MDVIMPFDILSDQKYKCDDLKSYERVELLALIHTTSIDRRRTLSSCNTKQF